LTMKLARPFPYLPRAGRLWNLSVGGRSPEGPPLLNVAGLLTLTFLCNRP